PDADVVARARPPDAFRFAGDPWIARTRRCVTRARRRDPSARPLARIERHARIVVEHARHADQVGAHPHAIAQAAADDVDRQPAARDGVRTGVRDLGFAHPAGIAADRDLQPPGALVTARPGDPHAIGRDLVELDV